MTEQEETEVMAQAIKDQFKQDMAFFVDTIKSWPMKKRKQFCRDVLLKD